MPRTAIVAALAVAAVLAAAAPPTAAQAPGDDASRKTSFVTFYGHVFDVGRPNPMPMNTEYPDGEDDFSAGYGGTCADGTPIPADPTGTGTLPGTCEDFQFNEAWFVSSAGFVDVADSDEFADLGGYGALHNERGLTKPVVLDTGQNVVATWYMSADAQGWPIVLCNPGGAPDLDDLPWIPWCLNWDPGFLYQWQVESTLYAAVLGEHGGGASEQADIVNAYQEGKLEIVAQGVSEPVDIVSLEAAGNPTVREFAINMGSPKIKEIPKEKSLVWRTQWHALVNGQRVMEDNLLSWNVNSGEFFPPRITLPVKNAFDVELVLPQFVHEKLVLHAIVNTPWGSYDVNSDSVALKMEARGGSREVEPTRIAAFADYSVAHGGHYRPVNVTYVWDYRGDRLAPGDYDVTVTASNHQGTATGSCKAAFRVRGDMTGEVLEVGRCGTVSEGAESFANQQQGGGGPSADLPTLPILGLAGLALLPLRRRDA